MGTIMMNGIEYNGGINANVNYSETEQVVGTWLNNKPLYQKTIHMSANFSSTKTYSIPTAEDLFLVDGFFVCTSGSTQYQVPLNYPESGYSSYSGWNKTTHNVYFRLAGFSSTDVYATVRYTKITD